MLDRDHVFFEHCLIRRLAPNLSCCQTHYQMLVFRCYYAHELNDVKSLKQNTKIQNDVVVTPQNIDE